MTEMSHWYGFTLVENDLNNMLYEYKKSILNRMLFMSVLIVSEMEPMTKQ